MWFLISGLIHSWENLYLFFFFYNGTYFGETSVWSAWAPCPPSRPRLRHNLAPSCMPSRCPFDDVRGWKHWPARSTIQSGNHGASSFSSRLQMKSKRPWSNRGPAARLRELRFRTHIRDGERENSAAHRVGKEKAIGCVWKKKKKHVMTAMSSSFNVN